MKHEKYSEEILNRLSEKYGKKFELETLYYEVNGSDGSYYRAICRESGEEDVFVAYYYLNGADYLLKEYTDDRDEGQIEKGVPLLVDEYSNLLLSKEYKEYLIEKKPEILYAAVDVKADGALPTAEALGKGLEACLTDGGFDMAVQMYLFVDKDIADKETFEEGVVAELARLDLYRQEVTISYIDKAYMGEIKKDYKDDMYRLEMEISQDERVTCYGWYLLEKGRGITNQKKVKGV